MSEHRFVLNCSCAYDIATNDSASLRKSAVWKQQTGWIWKRKKVSGGHISHIQTMATLESTGFR